MSLIGITGDNLEIPTRPQSLYCRHKICFEFHLEILNYIIWQIESWDHFTADVKLVWKTFAAKIDSRVDTFHQYILNTNPNFWQIQCVPPSNSKFHLKVPNSKFQIQNSLLWQIPSKLSKYKFQIFDKFNVCSALTDLKRASIN